jgi:hypothetical protein
MIDGYNLYLVKRIIAEETRNGRGHFQHNKTTLLAKINKEDYLLSEEVFEQYRTEDKEFRKKRLLCEECKEVALMGLFKCETHNANDNNSDIKLLIEEMRNINKTLREIKDRMPRA